MDIRNLKYDFPQYGESDITLLDLFTHIRNGYYDSNVCALKDFLSVFKNNEETFKHECAYIEANIKYADCVDKDDELGKRFYIFIMDIEESKRKDEKRHIGMEEYETHTNGYMSVDASYGADTDTVVLSIDTYDSGNSAVYSYDEVGKFNREDLESVVNSLYFYREDYDREDCERD
jgi:hypothetical protein